jgi:hypothetical protein
MHLTRVFLGTVAAMFVMNASAYADEYRLKIVDDQGRFEHMYIRISRSGEVTGNFSNTVNPDRAGQLSGHTTGDGAIQGIWTQPVSDRRCGTSRNGSRYWGYFTMTGLDSLTLAADWGYCDDPPSNPWKLSQ